MLRRRGSFAIKSISDIFFHPAFDSTKIEGSHAMALLLTEEDVKSILRRCRSRSKLSKLPSADSLMAAPSRIRGRDAHGGKGLFALHGGSR